LHDTFENILYTTLALDVDEPGNNVVAYIDAALPGFPHPITNYF
jgi:hypothetical protein